MTDEAMEVVRSALIDADHVANCSERLMAALNRQFSAEQSLSVEVEGDRIQEAAEELAQAQEAVSEFWRSVWHATYQYRKRAERARQAMGSNARSEPTGPLAAKVGSTDGLCHTGEE